MGKLYHVNTNQKKDSVPILMSDKMNIKQDIFLGLQS